MFYSTTRFLVKARIARAMRKAVNAGKTSFRKIKTLSKGMSCYSSVIKEPQCEVSIRKSRDNVNFEKHPAGPVTFFGVSPVPPPRAWLGDSDDDVDMDPSHFVISTYHNSPKSKSATQSRGACPSGVLCPLSYGMERAKVFSPPLLKKSTTSLISTSTFLNIFSNKNSSFFKGTKDHHLEKKKNNDKKRRKTLLFKSKPLPKKEIISIGLGAIGPGVLI